MTTEALAVPDWVVIYWEPELEQWRLFGTYATREKATERAVRSRNKGLHDIYVLRVGAAGLVKPDGCILSDEITDET